MDIHKSDILIYDKRSQDLRWVQTMESRENPLVRLGSLNELKDALLVVNTVGTRVADSHSDGLAEMRYTIHYGNTEVESTSLKPHASDGSIAFFNFRFPFCPRFPFC